jgi:hypothetical protein
MGYATRHNSLRDCFSSKAGIWQGCDIYFASVQSFIVFSMARDDSITFESQDDHTDEVRGRPILLNPIVGWCLVALLLILDILIVIISWYSQKHDGLFTILPAQGARENLLRLIWASGPTLVMTIIIGGVLAPMALALYLVAPYTELERGDARAEDSILANYAILGMFSRFQLAKRNRKWGLMSLAVGTFLASLLDTAASGFIESRNVNVGISPRDFTDVF